MATVTGLTAAKTLELLGNMIVGGSVDGSGHLILETSDGASIDAGDVTPPAPTLRILPRAAADAPSFYPLGISYFYTAAGSDWPTPLTTVQTTRDQASRSFQIVVGKTTGKVWVRSEGDTDTWGAFTELVPMVLASNAETQAAALTTKAVSPAGLASVVGVGTGYRLQQVVKFASSGTFSKASYPGLRAIRVKVQGGGGSGAGCSTAAASQNSYGTGGGGGGYAETFITDIAGLASSISVTVGASVSGGAVGANGNDGNGSSFGALAVAGGGFGGTTKASSTLGGYIPGGAGGDATVGDYRVAGTGGGGGFGAGTLAAGGHGGASHLGGGGRSVGTGAGGGTQVGDPGGNYGGGGGGAMANAAGAGKAGGSGAQGIVFVEIYV